MRGRMGRRWRSLPRPRRAAWSGSRRCGWRQTRGPRYRVIAGGLAAPVGPLAPPGESGRSPPRSPPRSPRSIPRRGRSVSRVSRDAELAAGAVGRLAGAPPVDPLGPPHLVAHGAPRGSGLGVVAELQDPELPPAGTALSTPARRRRCAVRGRRTGGHRPGAGGLPDPSWRALERAGRVERAYRGHRPDAGGRCARAGPAGRFRAVTIEWAGA